MLERGMRVAILEDDPEMRETMQHWLSEQGHEVVAFGRGDAFMRALGRDSHDLYLLDGNLPDMQGQDVLLWLRQQRNNTTPVMFVTARDAEEDIVAALQAGADDYLIKPVRRAELLARMQAVLRRIYPELNSDRLDEPPYRFDLAAKRVFLQQEEAGLTEKEYELALFLFRNIGRRRPAGTCCRWSGGAAPSWPPVPWIPMSAGSGPSCSCVPSSVSSWCRCTTTDTGWNAIPIMPTDRSVR